MSWMLATCICAQMYMYIYIYMYICISVCVYIWYTEWCVDEWMVMCSLFVRVLFFLWPGCWVLSLVVCRGVAWGGGEWSWFDCIVNSVNVLFMLGFNVWEDLCFCFCFSVELLMLSVDSLCSMRFGDSLSEEWDGRSGVFVVEVSIRMQIFVWWREIMLFVRVCLSM